MFKVTPEVFAVWLSLLRAVDDSVLWLLQPEELAMRAVLQRVARAGLAPDRIIFAPLVPPREHRARVAHADLALDCFPYGSHTTASDALWAGVPLIALMGETFASRVSASILTAAGLPELITRSLDDYERLALRLAKDRVELAGLKAGLTARHRAGMTFNTERFTRNLEKAFAAMWERHQRGLGPGHITVA
jgi:predicted O-linked N-acetylglucosamine transferase (SPINDLY family)